MELVILVAVGLILVETSLLLTQATGKLIKKEDKVTRTRDEKRIVFLDSSSLIDGRVLVVAETNFLGDEVVIPQSVVRELQLVADSTDTEKRARARFGLDVVAGLQAVEGLDVRVAQDGTATEGVDNRLIKLAKKYNGLIATNDFNLNKVAKVEGIKVLNINDLAMGLRPTGLPGEKVEVEIKEKGQEKDQGVGYLADGTMVVVANGAKKVGQRVEVELTKYLQTSAGKMMFAKAPANKSGERKSERKGTKRK